MQEFNYFTKENSKDFNYCNTEAVKMLSELDCKSGIGLIKKKKQGKANQQLCTC